jgi:hypothetical protein
MSLDLSLYMGLKGRVQVAVGIGLATELRRKLSLRVTGAPVRREMAASGTGSIVAARRREADTAGA